MNPVLLEEDKSGQARGEDSILAEIAQTSFASRNYADAEDKLTRFLRIGRSAKVEARAHFYVAQIQYLRGDLRDAFLTFLLADEIYYEDAQPWIDACFAELN